MYWFTRLDGINAILSIAGVLITFALVFLIVVYFGATVNLTDAEDEKELNIMKKWIKGLLLPWIFVLLGVLFIPTSKELAMIYVVPSITESQVIKQDLPEIYDLGVKSLKNWLKDKSEK
jgi:hypothetical protein